MGVDPICAYAVAAISVGAFVDVRGAGRAGVAGVAVARVRIDTVGAGAGAVV